MSEPTNIAIMIFAVAVGLAIVVSRLGLGVRMAQLMGVKWAPGWLERFLLGQTKRT